jgi:hypothetical protein
MDLAKDDNVFVTDFSDLIKQGICPHCRNLIQDAATILTHIKNCAGKEKVITTTWFTKKELKDKDKWEKNKEDCVEFGISFYKSDRPQTR